MGRLAKINILALFSLLVVLSGLAMAAGLVSDTEFGAENEIVVQFSIPVDPEIAGDPANYTVYEESDPDIRLPITAVSISSDATEAILSFADPLNTTAKHIVTASGIGGIDQSTFSVSKPYLGYLLTILLSALIINNFVFTKYLGLCVFFGTAKRKETAIVGQCRIWKKTASFHPTLPMSKS